MLATERLTTLKMIRTILSEAIDNAPEGTLKIRNSRGALQLYLCEKGTEVYISFPDAKEYATKRYHVYALKLVEQEILAIEKYLKTVPPVRFEDAFSQMPDKLKPYITPAIMTNEEYAGRWQAEPFVPKGFDPEDTTEFYTKKGERVRSKSEVLIANALYDLGIPYKYECPLVLYGGRMIFHPDFTILKVSTREEFYLEHAGILDKPGYSRKFVLRLKIYTENGIYFGDKLLFTCETEDTPLSTKNLDQYLRHFFL